VVCEYSLSQFFYEKFTEESVEKALMRRLTSLKRYVGRSQAAKMFVKYYGYVPYNLYHFALLFIRLRAFSVPSLINLQKDID